MGTLLSSCAKVREPMELSFEVVRGVGCSMGVLEGGPCPPLSPFRTLTFSQTAT